MSSKYVGQPSPELDEAWDKLTPLSKYNMFRFQIYSSLTSYAVPRIRLTHDELLRAGYKIDDALVLDDGDHTAILNVYHQLHCLVRDLVRILHNPA